MSYHYAEIQNGKVFTVSTLRSVMIQIELPDMRLLGADYDPETKSFSGFRVSLSADKPHIMANGVETVRIKASIKTWDEQDANETYSDPIMFIVDGTPKLIEKKTDGYYVDYKTTNSGSKIVRVQDTNFIDQANLSILAVEVEATE